MVDSAYAAAKAYARAGQVPARAKPTRPGRIKEHLVKNHGFDPDTVGEVPNADLAAVHDRHHSGHGGVNYGSSTDLRHHHEGVTDDDRAREQFLVQQRLSQTFSDRRHTGQRGIYG